MRYPELLRQEVCGKTAYSNFIHHADQKKERKDLISPLAGMQIIVSRLLA